jgi:N-methylhydantoinase B
MYIYRAKKQEKEVLRTVDMAFLEPGDVVITKAGGGGGWGNPLDRDVESVREDVKEEVVSIQRVRDVYGVVIDPKTLSVDYNETEQLRKKMRQ